MRNTGPLLLLVVLLVLAICMLGCGGSNRQLQSLSIRPAVGVTQVQFTAMGTFRDSGKTAPVSALWWTTQPWTYPPTPFIVTVSSTGFAQCQAFAPAGTYTIFAVAPVDPNMPLSQMSMTTKQVSATAQLTCL
jgi:hypothetical protein